MNADQQRLVEQATTAHRPLGPGGELRFHPAFHDLDAAGREELFAATGLQRMLERALDAQGLSTTGRAVLARIRGG
ncbi:MAG: hypothetical protein R3F29_03440 [Planctomycetota bacterium]